VNPRRPGRGPGGSQREGAGGGGGDDNPAQTNLGLLLQRALQQQAQQTTQPVEAEALEEAIEDRETKLCANCWNALTFKDDGGRMMARCGKDLWVRVSYSVEDLNANRVRRWYADCPEYDDSE